MLEPGVPSPDFTLMDHRGSIVRLSELRGHWVVLWWFPKAGSGVCSLQARGFQASWDRFESEGIKVIGISFDRPEDNCAFAQAEEFGFALVSDPNATTGAPFEVLRDEPDLLDRAKRITYLIDPSGIIRKSYDVGGDPEKAAEHADDVARDLAGMQDIR